MAGRWGQLGARCGVRGGSRALPVDRRHVDPVHLRRRGSRSLQPAGQRVSSPAALGRACARRAPAPCGTLQSGTERAVRGHGRQRRHQPPRRPAVRWVPVLPVGAGPGACPPGSSAPARPGTVGERDRRLFCDRRTRLCAGGVACGVAADRRHAAVGVCARRVRPGALLDGALPVAHPGRDRGHARRRLLFYDGRHLARHLGAGGPPGVVATAGGDEPLLWPGGRLEGAADSGRGGARAGLPVAAIDPAPPRVADGPGHPVRGLLPAAAGLQPGALWRSPGIRHPSPVGGRQPAALAPWQPQLRDAGSLALRAVSTETDGPVPVPRAWPATARLPGKPARQLWPGNHRGAAADDADPCLPPGAALDLAAPPDVARIARPAAADTRGRRYRPPAAPVVRECLHDRALRGGILHAAAARRAGGVARPVPLDAWRPPPAGAGRWRPARGLGLRDGLRRQLHRLRGLPRRRTPRDVEHAAGRRLAAHSPHRAHRRAPRVGGSAHEERQGIHACELHQSQHARGGIVLVGGRRTGDDRGRLPRHPHSRAGAGHDLRPRNTPWDRTGGPRSGGDPPGLLPRGGHLRGSPRRADRARRPTPLPGGQPLRTESASPARSHCRTRATRRRRRCCSWGSWRSKVATR